MARTLVRVLRKVYDRHSKTGIFFLFNIYSVVREGNLGLLKEELIRRRLQTAKMIARGES